MEETGLKNEILRLRNKIETCFDQIESKIFELSQEQIVTVSEQLDIYNGFMLNIQLRLKTISPEKE